MKQLNEFINEVFHNSGRIKEYDINVKLEHKTYSAIYTIIKQLANKDKKIAIRNIQYWLDHNSYDWEKIADEFWKNKDKDIVD